MTSTTANINQLREQTADDLKACDSVQARIDGLREKIANNPVIGNANVLFGVEQELETTRQVSKDMVRRIEAIYDLDTITATDREMLQVLNARQVASDKLVQRYAELSALQSESVGYAVMDAETEERMYLKESGDVEANKSKSSKQAEAEEDMGQEELPSFVDKPLQRWPTPPSEGTTSVSDARVESEHVEDVSMAVARPGHETESVSHEPEVANAEEEHVDQGKSQWSLLYKILDVDPETDERQWEAVVRLAYRKLATKHDPKHLPNDPDAPARWAAVTKAYETLKDPSKKQFYDIHGSVPVELADFDLSALRIGDD